jgi:hypothetical protein
MGWWANIDPQHLDNRQLNAPRGEESPEKDTDDKQSHHSSWAPFSQNVNNALVVPLVAQMNTI